MDDRCKTCFTNNYDKLLKKFPLTGCQSLEFCAFFDRLMDNGEDKITPLIQRELLHKFRDMNGITDPYLKEKEKSNKIALKLYKQWKPKVLASANPFSLSLRMAIAGNIMDYGTDQEFDVHETIHKAMHVDFAIDDSALLMHKIQEAKNILYLGDNAGEIVFDKLFLETIAHKHVVYAVRGAPVLNDATLKDAREIGIDLVADVISNGYDAPSTVLSQCSSEFLEVYNSADLIISKGQGNLEGLISERDPRLFFLLMVKCDVIGEVLNVKKGSVVVFNQNNLKLNL